jgi:hypothetical protein
MQLLHHALRNKRLGPGSRLRSIGFPSGRALLGRTLRLLAKITALQDQQPPVTSLQQLLHARQQCGRDHLLMV